MINELQISASGTFCIYYSSLVQAGHSSFFINMNQKRFKGYAAIGYIAKATL